jgi:hypothetical protein
MHIGHKTWIVPGGHIPLQSTGSEPAFTSRDEISILNTNEQEATIRITIYYTDQEPTGPYNITVKAQRVRHIRFNDLVDPTPVLLDTDYAAVITSNVPVVVQFTRLDTSQPNLATATTMAFPVGE